MQKKEIKYPIKFIIYSNSEIDFYFISTFIIILIKIYIYIFLYICKKRKKDCLKHNKEFILKN